jgi:hypothetical protein
MQGFDLQAAAPVVDLEEQGTCIELTMPDGEPMVYGEDNRPVTIRVAGTYSRRYKKAERGLANDALARKRKKMSDDEQDTRLMKLAAACVISWDGVFNAGEPLPCNEDTCVKVFAAAPWVYQQVLEAMQDHARFFTTSSPT